MSKRTPDRRRFIAFHFLFAALAFAWSTHALAAPDGLSPCESDNGYRSLVDAAIDDAATGQLLLGFSRASRTNCARFCRQSKR